MNRELDPLYSVLKREVTILQNLVDSLQKENQALLENKSGLIKQIIDEREEILKVLLQVKDERLSVSSKLDYCKKGAVEGQENLIHLLENIEDDSGTLKVLKDKVCELAERIEIYGERNSYLLKHKIHLTKKLIKKLHPGQIHSTYGPQGDFGEKSKKISTATIINQEG